MKAEQSSAMGQTRQFDRAALTSGFPQLADIAGVTRHLSKVPRGDMVVLFRHLENRGVRPVVQSKFGYDGLRSIHSFVLA
jgi:hypothetical protein